MTNEKAFKVITSDIKGDVNLKSIKVEPITNYETNRVNSYYVECDFDAIGSFMHTPSGRVVEFVSTYKRKAIINNESIIAKI